MSRTVVTRPQARRDVEAIALYIAQDNPDAARRFVVAADESFQTLATMPQMGPADDLGQPALVGLRRRPVRGFKNYLIFYRPTDHGIEVIRVLHGMRDYPKLFGD